jgi:hypothetical protein
VDCSGTTSESCSNGVITYCMSGSTSTLDCKQYGLSGCGTTVATGNQQTIAQCTP